MAEGYEPKPPTADSGLFYITKVQGQAFVRYRKIGQVVTLYAFYNVGEVGAIAPWASYNIGTLPTGYKPVISVQSPLVLDRSNCDSSIYINVDGSINITGRNTGASGSGQILQVTVTYLTAE